MLLVSWKSTKGLILGAGLFLTLNWICPLVAEAGEAKEASTRLVVSSQVAQQKTTRLKIAPGRANAISFLGTEETISHILLSDRSKLVYSTNAPVASGAAKIVYLRQIKNLPVSGATTSKLPNLFVVTIDKQGKFTQYQFDLEIVNKLNPETEIAISQGSQRERNRGRSPVNLLSTEDIKRGMLVTVTSKNLSSRDPRVINLLNVLDSVEGGVYSLSAAAIRFGVPVDTLYRLADVGRQHNMFSQ